MPEPRVLGLVHRSWIRHLVIQFLPKNSPNELLWRKNKGLSSYPRRQFSWFLAYGTINLLLLGGNGCKLRKKMERIYSKVITFSQVKHLSAKPGAPAYLSLFEIHAKVMYIKDGSSDFNWPPCKSISAVKKFLAMFNLNDISFVFIHPLPLVNEVQGGISESRCPSVRLSVRPSVCAYSCSKLFFGLTLANHIWHMSASP